MSSYFNPCMRLPVPGINVTRSVQKRLSFILLSFGAASFILGICIIVLTFYPVISVELSYVLSRSNRASVTPSGTNTQDTAIIPVNAEFGIIIPKIQANARIIANVNPYDSRAYQVALTKGVAHAKDSALPGQNGNIFLFSHSSVNFYEANRYNSVFYLLTKLEKGDEIILYYHKNKFEYSVTDKKIVEPADVSYLAKGTLGDTVTLMTCWPPGTTFRRLVVLAKSGVNSHTSGR